MLPLGSFCDVANYIGENLLGPVLAAVIGGPLAVVVFRRSAIPREIAHNDARAVELNEDLRRWVRDRNRQLERELRILVNQAGSGVVSRRPVSLSEMPPGVGSQLYSGALVNEATTGMREALHQYRDEASGKVREFSALARSEGRWHQRYRRRHKLEPASLGLDGQGRIALNRWRQRPHPVKPGSTEPDLVVDDDPTSDEPSIALLETETGLTWDEAAKRRIS